MSAVHCDDTRTLDDAAQSLGISLTRLLGWCDDNEWLMIGDSSYDVVIGQVEAGNLSVKRGTVRVTSQGMSVLFERFRKRADAVDSSRFGTGDVPF